MPVVILKANSNVKAIADACMQGLQAWFAKNDTMDGYDFEGSYTIAMQLLYDELIPRINQRFDTISAACFINKYKTGPGCPAIKIVSRVNKIDAKNCTYHFNFAGCNNGGESGLNQIYAMMNSLRTT